MRNGSYRVCPACLPRLVFFTLQSASHSGPLAISPFCQTPSKTLVSHPRRLFAGWFLFILHNLSTNVASSVVYIFCSLLCPKCLEHCLAYVIIHIRWMKVEWIKWYHLVFVITWWSIHCYSQFTMGKLRLRNVRIYHASVRQKWNSNSGLYGCKAHLWTLSYIVCFHSANFVTYF